MGENCSKVVCGHPATVAMLLMYQPAAPAEGAQAQEGSSEISVNCRLGFSCHLARRGPGARAAHLVRAVARRRLTLCFQGHDPRLISFQAPILTAGLSLYDTPG